jgi:hypothetical protein
MRRCVTLVKVIITFIRDFVCSGVGVDTNRAFGVKMPLHCWLHMVSLTSYEILKCVTVVAVVFLCRLATALTLALTVQHTLHVDLT